jgi:Tfp pilus assembly protein PilV
MLEVLITLVIISAVVTPLLMRMGVFPLNTNTLDRFTAQCLLEQQAAIIRVEPNAAPVQQKKVINGKEWVIQSDISGKSLKECRVQVLQNNKSFYDVKFYVYVDTAK